MNRLIAPAILFLVVAGAKANEEVGPQYTPRVVENAPIPHQRAPHPRSVDKARDWQDVVVLGEDRPHLLRFRMLIDGKPMSFNEDPYLDKVWTYLDVHERDWLSKEEAARAPSASTLNMYRTQPNFGFGGWQTVPFEEFDKNRDGKVSRKEFYDYYHRSGFGQVIVVNGKMAEGNGQGDPNAAITDVLFRLLDADGDGKLSKEELRNAAKILHRLDSDEDGSVSMAEIIGANPYIYYQQTQTGMSVPYAFLDVNPEVSKTVSSLIEFYDRDKDGKLSRDEIKFNNKPKHTQHSDHDGFLSVSELARFLELTPDTNILTRLGRRPDDEEQLEVLGPDGKPLGEKESVTKARKGRNVVRSGLQLELSRDCCLG